MTHHTQPVLVTGGTGFIAGHCILQLLHAGRPVRTTVRSESSARRARSILVRAGAQNVDLLEFVTADLTRDDGWLDATRGTAGVLHVASPVAPGRVENEDDLVVPAREGALRVLRAAADTGAPRVVLTSAFHAVGFGHGAVDRVFTEADWSPLDGPGMDAYGRSKVLSERAAWDFAERHPQLELVTMLPTAVVGPVLSDAVTGTNHMLQMLLNGRMPGVPDVAVPLVDVRDVAAAHISALGAPRAAGQRILVASQEAATPLREVAELLRTTFPETRAGRPVRRVPSGLIRAAALVVPAARSMVPDLGTVKRVSTARQHELLGISPRPWGTAVVDGARSMVERGLAG